MIGNGPRPAATSQSLRRAFDNSFAEPLRVESDQLEDLLSILVAGDAYALRLAEISGLFVDRRVTPLPGPLPELLGIAGFRGAMIPVYDLGTLLGYPGVRTPRWLVLSATQARIGLAFDQFDGHVRLPRAAITAEDRVETARRHAREIARTANGARPVLDLPSILDAIGKRARHGPAHKES